MAYLAIQTSKKWGKIRKKSREQRRHDGDDQSQAAPASNRGKAVIGEVRRSTGGRVGTDRLLRLRFLLCVPFWPHLSIPSPTREGATVRGFSDALPTRNGYGRRGRVQRIACLFWCRVQFTLLNYTDNVNNILRKLYLLVCLNYKSNANLFYPRLRTRNP